MGLPGTNSAAAAPSVSGAGVTPSGIVLTDGQRSQVLEMHLAPVPTFESYRDVTVPFKGGSYGILVTGPISTETSSNDHVFALAGAFASREDAEKHVKKVLDKAPWVVAQIIELGRFVSLDAKATRPFFVEDDARLAAIMRRDKDSLEKMNEELQQGAGKDLQEDANELLRKHGVYAELPCQHVYTSETGTRICGVPFQYHRYGRDHDRSPYVEIPDGHSYKHDIFCTQRVPRPLVDADGQPCMTKAGEHITVKVHCGHEAHDHMRHMVHVFDTWKARREHYKHELEEAYPDDPIVVARRMQEYPPVTTDNRFHTLVGSGPLCGDHDFEQMRLGNWYTSPDRGEPSAAKT